MQCTEPSNQIHLYPPQTNDSCQGDPVPRIDLLNESSVKALLCLLSILFPHQGPRSLYFDHCAMWTIAIPSLFGTYFQNAADFLGAVDAINNWLARWSSSTERQPDLQPIWATDRGLGMQRVQHLAEAFRDRLAKPTPLKIPLFGPDGRYFGLRIPSRHALTPPQAPSCRLEKIVVGSVSRMLRVQNLLGKGFLVGFRNGDDEGRLGASIRLRAGARLKLITVIDGSPIPDNESNPSSDEGTQR
jgi:hypothetical protein